MVYFEGIPNPDFPIQKTDVSFVLRSITSRRSGKKPSLDRESEPEIERTFFWALRFLNFV